MLGSVLFLVVGVFIEGSLQGINGPGIYQVTEPVDHAESPFWDHRKNILYFVDIHNGDVVAYHYDTDEVTKMHLNGDVSPVVPSKANQDLLLVGLNRSVVAVEWDGNKKLGAQKVLSTVSEKYNKSRFNDGKADVNGNLWWGTIGPEVNTVVTPNQGYLYKFTRENLEEPIVERSGVTNSNGIAWNKANTKMFYIDTPTLKVIEFDFDVQKSEISAENRTVFDLNNHSDKLTGLPDGMTIDEEDNLYIALYSGGAVVKVNSSNGELLQVISIPARDVTCPAWGGPNLDILFVSTSRVSLTEAERKQYPAAGSVFAVKNLNAKGFAPNYADIIDGIEKRRNILENFLSPELFTPNPKPSRTPRARNTEPSFWDTLVRAVRNFF